jgi:hypothetical protein
VQVLCHIKALIVQQQEQANVTTQHASIPGNHAGCVRAKAEDEKLVDRGGYSWEGDDAWFSDAIMNQKHLLEMIKNLKEEINVDRVKREENNIRVSPEHFAGRG